jgi:biotin transport system substrate-specific component
MFAKESAKKNSFVDNLISLKESQIFWTLTFTILTFASAQVFIPTQPVPFTLQTMIVLLSGAFLGSKNGAYSQVIYLLAGALGLPVFAGFDLGFARLFGPTGGYLISFPFAAFLVGYILEKKNNSFVIALSFIIGELFILLAGASYLSVFFNGNFSKALFSGAVIFSVWDLIKIAAAFSVYKAISKKYPKLPA